MAVFQCEVCHFIYNENKGLILEGIPAATKWNEIDDNWICPDCGVKKDRFKKISD